MTLSELHWKNVGADYRRCGFGGCMCVGVGGGIPGKTVKLHPLILPPLLPTGSCQRIPTGSYTNTVFISPPLRPGGGLTNHV